MAEAIKLNGSVNGLFKKQEEEIHPHEVDPGLVFTGRFEFKKIHIK